MKNPERVAELLAELRALTETDFERHRIDVLERDLTAPPTVEVIDDNHQRFNGVIFHKDRSEHYVTYSTGIHRFVWQYHHGEIPTGYQIHHVDGDKSNNTIANLQCLTKQEHSKIHRDNMPCYETICEVCGKTYFASVFSKSNRFCSARCRNHAQNERYRVERTCAYCGKKFLAFRDSTDSSCCSHSCASKLLHQKATRQKHFVEKTCPICGKKFTVTLTRKNQVCCSFSCSRKLMWQNKKANAKTIEKICPVCNASFTTTNPQKIYCSTACNCKASHQRNKTKNHAPT